MCLKIRPTTFIVSKRSLIGRIFKDSKVGQAVLHVRRNSTAFTKPQIYIRLCRKLTLQVIYLLVFFVMRLKRLLASGFWQTAGVSCWLG